MDRSSPGERDPAGPGRTSSRARRAVGAGPAKHDVMGFDAVAEALRDPLDELLELGVLEGVEPAAAVADRVVVVLAAGVGGLVARRAVDIDAPDESEPGEHVDRAVDAREPDGALLVAEAVVDRLGAEAALLAGEQVEDLLASAAAAVARAGELALRVGLPFRLGHAAQPSARLQMRISFSIVIRADDAGPRPARPRGRPARRLRW